jgi:hypothetical protein
MFAIDRNADRPTRRPMLPLMVTIFVAAFVLTATAIVLKDPHKTQLSLCDGKYLHTARVISDVLEWTPIGHKYEVAVYTVLAAIGLASASCAVTAPRAALSDGR